MKEKKRIVEKVDKKTKESFTNSCRKPKFLRSKIKKKTNLSGKKKLMGRTRRQPMKYRESNDDKQQE